MREIGLGSVGDQNGLTHARQNALEYRSFFKAGNDPLLVKFKRNEVIETKRGKPLKFNHVLEEFSVSKDKDEFFTTAHTRSRWHYYLLHHAKGLHDKHISEISTKDVFKVIEPICVSKTETASRTRLYVEAVLSWAKTME